MKTSLSIVRSLTLFAVVFLSVFLSRFSLAAVRYVDVNAIGSNNTGEIDHPWISLQTALANAADEDEIRIAQGTYKPHATIREISFEISDKNLILHGGWINNSGTWTPIGDSTLTVLSGNINDTGTTTDNSYTVLKLSHSGATNDGTRIECLTIRDGRGDNAGLNTTDFEQRTGAGVRITAGAPRFHNVTITNNGVLEQKQGTVGLLKKSHLHRCYVLTMVSGEWVTRQT